YRGPNQDGTAGLLRARSEIKGVQTLVQERVAAAAPFAGAHEDVDDACRGVDDGSGRDADLGSNEVTVHILGASGVDAGGGVDEASAPERFGGVGCSVEGVDAVVGSDDEHDVVTALAGDIQARDIEGLCVDVAINRKREQRAKLFRGDGARRED